MIQVVDMGSMPMRTCVGCRSQAPQNELLRVVLQHAELVPDQHRRLSGRGAYVHLDLECIERAIQRRSFIRALRAPQPLGFAQLLEFASSLSSPQA
jgi:predicted RNA-binding protein YlxR (DUF448 family)